MGGIFFVYGGCRTWEPCLISNEAEVDAVQLTRDDVTTVIGVSDGLFSDFSMVEISIEISRRMSNYRLESC